MTSMVTDLAPAILRELRKSAGTPGRRWLFVASGVVGLLSVGLITFLGSAADHTFAVISFYTQSAISLPLPFVSVLLMTQDFGRQAATTLTSGRSPVGVACAIRVRAEPAVWPHGRPGLGSCGRHCACVGHRAQPRRATSGEPTWRKRRTLNSSSIG